MRGMFIAGVAMSVSSLYANAVQTDVFIYGATPAGITAAIESRRAGRSVVLVEPSRHIGGLTTGGLGWTDTGDKSAYGGLARQFYADVKTYYDNPAAWRWMKPQKEKGDTKWTFEPSVARKILDGWLAREGIVPLLGERLDRAKGGVALDNARRIVCVKAESGNVYKARVFVDATYEGDLMAAAGVKYFVGREASGVYGEEYSGVQVKRARGNQLPRGISAYRKDCDPSSGLLPGIDPTPVEPDGTGDKRVQAYCYRLTLTNVERNRRPLEKPAHYDESEYEILLRMYERGLAKGLPYKVSPMPNRKTDSNNTGGFSMDYIGRNWNYPEASYAEREKMHSAHRDYQQGLLWTMANHPRIPQDVRDAAAKWGLCRDEFPETDGWTPQLYVREARRMVSGYVMTDRHCRGLVSVPRPVALASYQMDSHNVRRYVADDGTVRNEGDVQVHGERRAFGIDYLSIVPKKGECANLIVPICLSASHMAYGAIRMEPVFFALGQSAGAAASLACVSECAVQDVPYAQLREKLVAGGQVIEPPVKNPKKESNK